MAQEKLTEVRLNKYLSEAGFCSRREADRLVEAGAVCIDGEPAVNGQKVKPGQAVTVKGKRIESGEPFILIAMNKPRGIVCTSEKREKNNVIDFLKLEHRVYPVGRLDKDSEGLLLLTNDGELANTIMKARNQHEKEYIVNVDKQIDRSFIESMSNGVPVLDTVTRPCKVKQLGKNQFSIVLTQGLNRQIRRMCEHLGFRVVKLKRIRIMNITLGNLKTGHYRNISDGELRELKKLAGLK